MERQHQHSPHDLMMKGVLSDKFAEEEVHRVEMAFVVGSAPYVLVACHYSVM